MSRLNEMTLTIPPQGQVLGIVGNVIIALLLHLLLRHLTLRLLPLSICSGLNGEN